MKEEALAERNKKKTKTPYLSPPFPPPPYPLIKSCYKMHILHSKFGKIYELKMCVDNVSRLRSSEQENT